MTMRAIVNDKRYRALPTLAEKKSVLAEFQAEKRKIERVLLSTIFFHIQLTYVYQFKEEKRKKDTKSKEAFVTMLKECEHLHPKMTWR